MAASEAFLNSIIGGADATDSGADTTHDGDAGAASGAAPQPPAEDGGPASDGIQAGSATAMDGRTEQRQPPGDQPKAAGQPDQVANLNAAIRETRTENKALKAQLQELTAKIEALSKPQQPAEQAQEPDFLADPKGYVDAARKDLKSLTEKIEANEKQQKEQQAQQQQVQETWTKVLESEEQFVATTPDYHQALAHVRQVRTQQLQMLHPEATQQQIASHIQSEEFQGAAALIAQGKNPSEFYYNYAKTFGYKPAAAPPPPVVGNKPDKDAVRTMGSGGAAEHVGGDEPTGALGILAAAQNEHKAQFKRRK